jgi:hypothetical protein
MGKSKQIVKKIKPHKLLIRVKGRFSHKNWNTYLSNVHKHCVINKIPYLGDPFDEN